MGTRQAPYRHSDGSGCWTKNCSLGHQTALTVAAAQGDVTGFLNAKTATQTKPTKTELLNLLGKNAKTAVSSSKGSEPLNPPATAEGDAWRSQIQPRLSEEHLMEHRAPDGSDEECYRRASDLASIFPKDVMEHPDWYCGEPDPKAIAELKRIQGNPDAMVTIYRAAPKEVTHIQDGDWVTLSKPYAVQHGYQSDGSEWPVIEARVPARVLWTEGNDLNEFGISLMQEKN